MRLLLLVATGGAAGSVLRYLAGLAAKSIAGDSAFPWGTLVVNVLGCAAIGAVLDWLPSRGEHAEQWRCLLVVGVLGGFTTFSAFGAETLALWRAGQPALALANVAAQLLLGVAAVAGGAWLRASMAG